MTKQKPLNFILVLTGLCFFFNPYFAVIDILPDFIGCLLIAIGLLPTARMHAPMREAQLAFLRLALIDVAKNVLLMLVFGGSAMGEQEILVLIVAFLGATLGTLFAVLAVRALFDGLDTLAITYDCEALYGVRHGDKSHTEIFARFTAYFIIFKEALLLLPEFAALLNSTYVDSDLIRIYDYIGVMRFLVIIPAMIAGVWWLVWLLLYFKRLHREKEFLTRLGTHYQAFMAEHPGIRIKAKYAVAFTLIGVGVFFFTDFYVDYQNILPDTVGGILVLIGVLLLGLPFKKQLPVVLTTVLYTAIATLSTNRSYLFTSENVGADINRSEAVASEYLFMWLMSLAELVCFLVFLVFLLISIRAVLIKWGAYRPEYTDPQFEERHYMRMREEFDWQFIKCGIFGFISALLSFFYDYFQTWPDKKIFRLMEALWIPDFLFALLFAAYTAYVLTLVLQKIKERFQFE